MGNPNVTYLHDGEKKQKFIQQLLRDVTAIEYLLENNLFESGIRRIGAEQEMCLVDNNSFRPAMQAIEVIDLLDGKDFVETELGKFNLETTQTPQEFKGKALSNLEKEVSNYLKIIQKVLDELDSSICLVGVLPTLKKNDLVFENLTPKKRYFALMKALKMQNQNQDFEINLSGIDELNAKHDSPLLEAANTSFQVHLQVSPENFVKMYNISQVLAAPILGISSNSSIVFGKRLWHESRIALFQQSCDTRNHLKYMREQSPRVNFGTGWLKKSILEIYKEDIARFRVLLAGEEEEDSLAILEKGGIPKLKALQTHNGTVYRWNRPCYGISENGKPHLRIENRIFPAGPTVVDEIANAALWLGCMVALCEDEERVEELMLWEDVKDNFFKASKYGIDSTFTWVNNEKIECGRLILDKLIPLARKGLEIQKIDKADIDKYLGIIKARTEKHTTGARWMLQSYTSLKSQVGMDEALSCLTSYIVEQQKKNIPVHLWDIPNIRDLHTYNPSELLVENFMSTDVSTVRQTDIIEFAGKMMSWGEISHIPVENEENDLVGVISSSDLVDYFTTGGSIGTDKFVKDIMTIDLITVAPKTSILDAMNLMKSSKINCLLVTQGNKLVGLVTNENFLEISRSLIERLARK